MKLIVNPSENLVITDESNPSRVLRLDMSPFYCRLFESTRDQSRDYIEEILRWSEGEIENFDYVSTSIMHCTAARRRSFGFTK